MNRLLIPLILSAFTVTGIGLPSSASALRISQSGDNAGLEQNIAQELQAGLEVSSAAASFSRRGLWTRLAAAGAGAMTAGSVAPVQGISVAEMLNVFFPLVSFHDNWLNVGLGIDPSAGRTVQHLLKLRERAAGILSQREADPEFVSWVHDSQNQFDRFVDSQAELDRQADPIKPSPAQRLWVELHEPQWLDVWVQVGRFVRYARYRPRSKTEQYGFAELSIREEYERAKRENLRTGEAYWENVEALYLIPVLAPLWREARERLRRRGIETGEDEGVQAFLDQLKSWRNGSLAAEKVSLSLRAADPSGFMAEMEKGAIVQVLAPHVRRLEDWVGTRYGDDALKALLSFDLPNVYSFHVHPWGSPIGAQREPTVAEIVAEAEQRIASRVREHRVAILVKQAVERLQKARREGAPISDQEINETERRIHGLSDEALTLQGAVGWLDNMLEPFLARLLFDSGRIHHVGELAAQVAEEARFHPVDLWIHAGRSKEGTAVHDLYWTPVGKGRDRAFRILTPAELGMLYEASWHLRYESGYHHLYYYSQVSPSFRPGVRYRIPVPTGVRAQALDRFLRRHDWRSAPTVSPTGNVVEVEWPPALPFLPPTQAESGGLEAVSQKALADSA